MEIGNSRTEQVLQAALNGLAARQRAISDNVANVDTPGFKASRVEFEETLKAAMGRDEGRPKILMLTRVENGVSPPSAEGTDMGAQAIISSETSRRLDGNNVDIDQEMVKLAETNLTYNALAQLTNSRLALLRTIVNDGRR
ncbi:MAG: flagellar basal body rod protein FlgB [Chloroflexota bacterium]